MLTQNKSTKALRELLLLKSEDSNVKLFLQAASDVALEKLVVESLKKMASLSGKRSVKMNASVRDFLNNAVAEKQADEPNPMEHLRDALGHHASHYAAAKAAGNNDLAETHAKQFTKLGHLASKLDSSAKTIADFEPGHSPDYRANIKGVADFQAPDLQAWQATSPQHFADANKTSGVDITGWRAHEKQTGVRKRGDGVSAPNKESFAWYASSPEPSHRDTVGHKAKGHDRGYPFEQVKVNNKFIPVGMVESPGTYESHPFDSHPIVEHFNDTAEEHANLGDAYKNKLSAFEGGEKGMKLALKGQELARPEHGAQAGMTVHPKVTTEGVK